jgi:predicted membrane chloride channel (bestrophin family)
MARWCCVDLSERCRALSRVSLRFLVRGVDSQSVSAVPTCQARCRKDSDDLSGAQRAVNGIQGVSLSIALLFRREAGYQSQGGNNNTMTTTVHQQRLIKRPTLLEVVNGNRCVTMIRLAQASQLNLDIVREVIRSNSATPQVAARIAAGLTEITKHRFSVLDIELSVHPAQ